MPERSPSPALLVAGAGLVKLGGDALDQLARLEDTCVRAPFEDPRHDRGEIGDREREHDAAVRGVLDDLGRMPATRGDQGGLVAGELDHDASFLRGITDVDPERAVEHVRDGEIRGNVE